LTYEEKKDTSLLRAKLYQLIDIAECKPAAKSNDMVVIQCQKCSSGIAFLEDVWNKREESRSDFRCPGCKRKIYLETLTNMGLSLH
jgi:hypothetical protein